MTALGRMATGAAALALALGAAACGKDDPGARTTEPPVAGVSAAGLQPSTDVAAPATHPQEFDPHRIYAEEAQGVVTILSIFDEGGGLGALLGDGPSGGQGSGFVISEDGEIATNAHVVTQGEGEDVRAADRVYVQFRDRNEVEAEIVGFDPDADVALLEIDPAGLDLRPLPFAPLSEVTVGEPVAAIGSPYGEPQSLSVGVVSALDRSIESLTGFGITGAIQTDAAINSGNSGGPLLDAEGRVIGINSQIKSSSGSGSGVGFAVSSDTARRSLDELREDGEVEYAYLGLSTVPVFPQLADRFDLGTDTGAWVQTVTPGGPADRAGIVAGDGDEVRFHALPYTPGGDVIVAVDGRPIHDESDVPALLQRYRPGDQVELTVLRDGGERVVTVTLGERPAASAP
ncbi:MAG TPA: trypsin-like peptidase domain-containing protein [Capillimicrobium sp.]|nr:trypsin-like peptidase domain-containing protein [Capillimicrobium sp.]